MSPCLQNPTSCLQQSQVGPTPMGRQPSPKSQGSFGGRKLVRASSLEEDCICFVIWVVKQPASPRRFLSPTGASKVQLG